MQIGLRIYKVQVYHGYNLQSLSSDTGPADVLHFVRGCCAKFSTTPLDDGISKVVRFEPSSDFKHSAHGILRYGKYGYESTVEDRKLGALAHTRTINQADTIPLYYRFWLAPGKKYGLLGLQSFGGNSCVDIVTRAVVNTHKLMHDDWRLTMTKLMPNDNALYGDRLVQSVQLVRKNSDQSVIDQALRPVGVDTKVDVELSLKARGGGSFGRLKDLSSKIDGHLEIGDLEFAGAFAIVKVGSSFKRIGIFGVSSTAGVIDLTDDVVIGSDNHPTFDTLQKATTQHMSDFAALLG